MGWFIEGVKVLVFLSLIPLQLYVTSQSVRESETVLHMRETLQTVAQSHPAQTLLQYAHQIATVATHIFQQLSLFISKFYSAMFDKIIARFQHKFPEAGKPAKPPSAAKPPTASTPPALQRKPASVDEQSKPALPPARTPSLRKFSAREVSEWNKATSNAAEPDTTHFALSTEPRLHRYNTKYRIGQIVEHKDGWRAVIVGWDHNCKAPDAWMKAQAVTPARQAQAWYLILGDSPLSEPVYVCEADIAEAQNRSPVHSGQLHAFFHSFDPVLHRHVPNDHLALRYPADFEPPSS
eukprot:m.505445 g.505445  ORF g.505445 m.505445 type:complete len:294 (-) comp57365_c0_seq7:117-998(-)